MQREAGALDAGPGRDLGQRLERVHELGPAVRVPGVVDGIHPRDEIAGAERLREAERDRQEHRVARGHVGDRDAAGPLGLRPVFGHRDRGRERRAADGAQVELDDPVRGRAQRVGDARRGLELDGVALPVAEAQGVTAPPGGPGHGQRRRRIDPTRQKHDRVAHEGA